MRLSEKQFLCSSSKELLRKYKYYVTETGFLIHIGKLTPNKISQALRLHFSKRKIDIFKACKFEHKILTCAFCGKPNNTYYVITDISSKKHITITDIKYKKPIHYCFGKKCPGKKLNPNSKEFVSKTRNISIENANLLIIERNKSPFYAKNHRSIEEYKKYQGTRLTENKTEEEYQKILDKQNFSRSKECYNKKFPLTGIEMWNNTQKRKGITKENLINKYGNEKIAIKKLNEWKKSIGPSLSNFKRRYGDKEGLEKYRKFHNETSKKNRSNAFGVISVSPNGDTLRSNYERAFYDAMIKTDLITEEYSIDGYYPDSCMRYDFFFPKINCYIEIAGLKSDEYFKKLNKKIELFHPTVLTPKDVSKFEEICYNIKQMLIKE